MANSVIQQKYGTQTLAVSDVLSRVALVCLRDNYSIPLGDDRSLGVCCCAGIRAADILIDRQYDVVLL